MGTSLSGLTPATTFDGLLKTSDNEPLDGTLKAISTGDGTDTILSLSNSALSIGGDVTITGTTSDDTANSLLIERLDGTDLFQVRNDRNIYFGSTQYIRNGYRFYGDWEAYGIWDFNSDVNIGTGTGIANTRLLVKGSGATSATTSLLVQNSAGSDMFKVADDSRAYLNGSLNINRDNTQNAILLGNAAGSTKAVIHRGDSGGLVLQGGPLYYKNEIKVGFGQNDITFATDSSQRMVINPTGQIGMGETTPTARLHLKGSGNDNTSTSLLVQNSDGADALKVRDDKKLIIGGDLEMTSSLAYLSTKYVQANNYVITNQLNVGGLAQPPSGTAMRIQGDGATSATTALLVQNSAGTTALEVLDNRDVKLTLGTYQFLSSGFISYAKGNVNSDFGVGFTTNPTARLQVKGSGNDATTTALLVQNSDGTELMSLDDVGGVRLGGDGSATTKANIKLDAFSGLFNVTAAKFGNWNGAVYAVFSGLAKTDALFAFGNDVTTASTRMHIKGLGATSATTALLVENSAGTDLLRVEDGGTARFSGQIRTTSGNSIFNGDLVLIEGRIYNSSPLKGELEMSDYNLAFGDTGDTTPTASAAFQVNSTTRGFLPPRMTTTERDAITSPAAGLMVYNTTTNKAQCYNGTAWQDLF